MEALKLDFLHRLGAFAAFSLSITVTASYADQGTERPLPVDDWQVSRLMQPSQSQLAAEKGGQVYIYDSLGIDLVDAAMDQHFGRIEHMMFVRIHHPPSSEGAPEVVEDDGCD
ncbi:MAG: hypothetical protein PVJ03_08830 [Chromatiaceae bacterium]|jgi:hypothetical protein